jgi:methenyltetrahydromethanopterin cyclohydrolase
VLSVNEQALAISRRLVSAAEAQGVVVLGYENGVTVIDCGIEVPGSLEAGRLFSEVCLGGLGSVQLRELHLDGLVMPGVEVGVSHPVVACMACQYAGWAVKAPKTEDSKSYFAMGSGPARALYRGDPIFSSIDYRDPADVAVLTLESGTLPPPAVTELIAEKCGVSPDKLHLLMAPTACTVGSVQVAARIVETGIHKMHEVGFDINTVRSGFGSCPLAPVAADDLTAIGRTNDGVLYGGRAWYTVQTDDDQLESVIEQLPSSSSKDYGTTFGELFHRYDHDFYKIDPLLFSPAEVTITNLTSGRTFRAGGVDSEILRQSFFA